VVAHDVAVCSKENQNIPRILITPIDSKKAFIRLAKPWKPEEWKDKGKSYFLDLRTLAWALFNRSFSLKRLCEELQTEDQKVEHEPTGEVTSKKSNTHDRMGAVPSILSEHPKAAIGEHLKSGHTFR